MKKRKTLDQRGLDYANSLRKYGHEELAFKLLDIAWVDGYRAAQRDARRKRK